MTSWRTIRDRAEQPGRFRWGIRLAKEARFLGWAMISMGMVGMSSIARCEERAEAVRVLFVGDVMLDNGPGHWISHGRDPFEPCAELLQRSDLTIGNLECVVGKGGSQINKAYTFRAASDSPRYLGKYFDAVSLANNHSWDYGSDGFRESLRVLREAGIPFFGGGNHLQEARKPLVVECKGRRIAFLGYNEFRASNYAATETTAGNVPLVEEFIVEDLRKAREELGCDIAIPYLHWGEELVASPRQDQRQLARRLIDAGATAVIGAHPHVTQTMEIYRGAPIVYSLGNFVFDYYPGDPEAWTGWAVELSITRDNRVDIETTVVELDPIGIPRVASSE